MLILLFFCVYGKNPSTIPITGSPPNRRYLLTAIFDLESNQLISFCGFDYNENGLTSQINAFNLESKTWKEIIPESSFSPSPFQSSKSYLRSDRKVLIFFGENVQGISSDVYSFDLKTNSWRTEKLIGDTIEGRSSFGFTSFLYLGNEYVGVFGGLTHNGQNNDLFMINVDTLEVEKLEKTGEVPNKILGASLSFYDRAFYLFGYYWPESQSDNTKQELYKYDLALRTWEIVDVLGDKPEHRVYSSTFVYNDELFLVYGVIIDTSETLSSICKFTFASKTWTFLSDVSGDDVINSGIAQYNSFAYLVFGRSSNEIYNSVSYLDLSEAIPKKVYLTTNWDSPSKRKNHCSIVVNDHLLIFGGVTNKGTHLNDIWSFDFTNNHWVYLIVTGAIPSARQQAACTKIRDNGLMIFGGTNLVESFNDLYFFDTTFYVWILITPEAGVSPTPRHSACLAAFNLELFILGGRDDANVYDQFWHFVYLTNKFTLINENDPIKLPIFDYKCWTDIENLAPVVYVIGGRLINFKPVNTIYKIQILEKNKEFSTVTSLHHEYSMALPSQSGFVKSGDYVYLIFGAYWEYISVPYIFELNYKTKAETMWPFDTEYSIYSHIAEHYKDSIYVFGGGISIGRIIMGMSANNNLLKIDRSESVLTRLECSRGTIGDTCEPCKAGYYEQNSECIPCPSGRYSVIIASTTAFQCLPCDYGFFNYKEGNSYCFECLSQDYCPIGSMEPITKGSSPSYLSIQPLEYQPDITLINQLVNNLWYASGGLVCLVLLFGLVFHDLFEKIKKIDCFADSHSQDLNVPVIHRKTKVGGFFTILFALAAGITVIGLFLSYNLNNIIESKSLVPLLTLDTEISAATLEITTAFYVYSGKCVQDSECIPENTFFYAGFEFLSNKTVCKKEGTTCIVSITYYGFSISSTSTVNIQLLESSACASVITVNVTSTSSIPGESSSVFLPIFTGSDFKVFLGAKPTIVNFELTPSVFTSESSEWSSIETGYHVAVDKEVELGSLNTVKTFNSDTYLLVTLSFQVSNTGLVTKRVLNNTLLIFVGGVLGAVFGLMGSFASIMGITEGVIDYASEKIAKDKKFRRINVSRKLIRSFLLKKLKNKIKPSNYKVTPAPITYFDDSLVSN